MSKVDEYYNRSHTMTEDDWAMYQKEYEESFKYIKPEPHRLENAIKELSLEELESLLPSIFSAVIERRIKNIRHG